MIASLALGAMSIRVAADMTAAAAPPSAPPMSLDSLQAALAAEQARGAALQAELVELTAVTDELTAALTSTEGEVQVDGLTAKELRTRLKAADAKLKTVNRLLKDAQRRLAALGATSVATQKPVAAGGGGSKATPTPIPTVVVTGFDMRVEVVPDGVLATWTTCSVAGFDSYTLVRSPDSELHYPPEGSDTLVTKVTAKATTSYTDTESSPSGSVYYRLYCLTASGGQTQIVARSSIVRATVP